MKIIPPVKIDDTRLLSSTVAEPAMGEFEWISGQPYLAGKEVIRSTLHKKYVALVDIHNSTLPPEDDFENWQENGATLRYAMFDYDRNTASTASQNLTVVIAPRSRVNSIACFGLTGEKLKVTVRDGEMGSVIFTKEIELKRRIVNSWYTYFFAEFVQKNAAIIYNIPNSLSAHITLEFTGPGIISVAAVVLGNAVDIGSVEMGAESDILDFSTVDRDPFGNALLVPKKNIPRLNARIFTPRASLPQVIALRRENTARPLAFIGVDDELDPIFEAVSMIGIFKRMPIVVEYKDHVLINLEAEGI